MSRVADPGARAARDAGAPVLDAFEPHPLLRGFHRMTLASMFVRRDVKQPVPVFEERVFRVDGDTRVLALCSWRPDPSPVLVIVHGLAGHADRPYMRGTVRKAHAAGLHVVRLNVRNCGDTEHLAGSLYHAGLVADLEAVVRELDGEARCTGVHLAGFSMGGNVVLRLGGLWADDAPASVRSIVAVSPVVDLAHCAANIDGRRGLGVYRNSFLRRLKATYVRRAQLDPRRYDVARVEGARTLREFDAAATAPDCGFADVDDYYREASCRRVLAALRVPSLVIHARDDLLVPFDDSQLGELRAAPAVRLALSDHGGHCGFVSSRPGPRDADRYWAENRLVDYVLHLDGAP